MSEPLPSYSGDDGFPKNFLEGNSSGAPELPALKRECHRLIEQIARRPGPIKLLLIARNALQPLAQYKQKRRDTRFNSEQQRDINNSNQ